MVGFSRSWAAIERLPFNNDEKNIFRKVLNKVILHKILNLEGVEGIPQFINNLTHENKANFNDSCNAFDDGCLFRM